MIVTIYTAPGCQQCKATERAFLGGGVQVQLVDALDDIPGFEKKFGSRQLPGVIVQEDGFIVDSWTGFSPDEIQHQIARYSSQEESL